MSGRGRGRFTARGQGRGSRGRGSGRGSGRGNSDKTNINSQDEMKFAPFYQGKQSGATCNKVKQYIALEIQKRYKFGDDLACAIKKETDFTSRDQLVNHVGMTKPKTHAEGAKPSEWEMVECEEAIQ